MMENRLPEEPGGTTGQEEDMEYRLPLEQRYDLGSRHFAQVVQYRGEWYDAHTGETGNGTCVYRRLNQRFDDHKPFYVEVDSEGYVVAAWGIDDKEKMREAFDGMHVRNRKPAG